MIKKSVVAAACILSVATGATHAQGLYGGISLGIASVDVDQQGYDAILTAAGASSVSSSTNETDVGYKAYLGYSFTSNFAIEGGYVNLGSADYKASYTGGSAKIDWESHGMFVQAVGRAPIGNAFALLGKGGLYFSESQADIRATGPGGTATANVTENEVNFVLGIGGEYAFSNTTALRVEWERFLNIGDKDTIGESDVDLVTVGLSFKF
ncbi:MAG: outer membrane beta-barrel protein [Rhodocyclaceae bacterium]|nr:outer membrane beta-barrel protein [Rhodocyclaceae bacterium]